MPLISNLVKYGASGLGLTAAGALSVGYLTSRFTPQQPNTFSVAYQSATDFVQSSLFRDPYSELRNNYGSSFTPQLQGHYSQDKRTFYEQGNPLKPLRVEDDTFLTPSIVEGTNNRSVRSQISLSESTAGVIGAGVGVVGSLALTRALDLTGIAIHRAGRHGGSARYLSSLFEEGRGQYGRNPPSMGKNLMPFALGGIVGGVYGGPAGFAAGGAIGSYVGGYLLMKEELGPGLRKYPAAILYGAIAGSFVAHGLVRGNETATFSASGAADTGNTSGYLRPDFYKSLNPFKAVDLLDGDTLEGKAPYLYQNPNPYSKTYYDLQRMISLDGDFTPNYRSNSAYRLRQYTDKVKSNGQSNVFDYLNPLFAAGSATFLSVGMGMLAAQQFSKVMPNHPSGVSKFVKDSFALLGMFNDYDNKQASLDAQKAVGKSTMKLLESLVKGQPRSVLKNSLAVSGSLLSLAKQEGINNLKGLALSGIVGLSAFHLLNSYQQSRKEILTGDSSYASPTVVDSSNVISSALASGTITTLATYGAGSLASRVIPKLRGKELPIALLLGAVGAIAGGMSSRELVDNSNYQAGQFGSPIEIYEGAAPSGTSSGVVTKVQKALDRSRYFFEGMATPVSNGNVFYDSGTIGKGFMSFLHAAPSNSLIGSYYELSSDSEFLSLLKAKAAPEGFGVSMGGNVSLFDPEGGIKLLLQAAGHGFGLQYLLGKTINAATSSVGLGTAYRELDARDHKYKEKSLEGRLTNSLLYGAGTALLAPTVLNFAKNRGLKMPVKGLGMTSLVLGSALLGGLLADTNLHSEGAGLTKQGLIRLFGSTSSALEAYALNVGKNTSADTNRGNKGGFFDNSIAGVGRLVFTGGIDVTDKTVPIFLGEKYRGSATTGNITLHSKMMVTTEASGVDAGFVSTGNIGSLIESSRGHEEQINFGMLIRDKAVVKEMRTAIKVINSLTPEQSLSDLAGILKNVILGGKGADSLQRIVSFIDNSKGDIHAAFAYPSSETMVSAFSRKLKAGVQVTILGQNPYGVQQGGNPEKTAAFYRKLIHEGANVYLLPKGSDLLAHAKAIYTPNQGLTTSHNFSNASDAYVVEAGVALQDPQAGKAGIQAVKRAINKFGFLSVKEHPDLFKEFLYNEDYLKFKKRLAEDPFYSLVRPAALAAIDEDLRMYQGVLYLPTTLSEGFASKYPNSKPQLYTDFYYTLTGKMPSGFQKYLARTADSQLGGVSFGSFINRIFPDLYSPGDGLVGTLAKGVGRVLDTATGFYAFDYYDKLRNGDLRGSLNKYHQNQYKTNQQRGLFENLLGGLTTTAGATASSLAFYFGVSHTLSIARSHFEDIGVDYVTNLLSNSQNNVGDRALKSFFFSGDLLNVFSEIEGATIPGVKGKKVHDYFAYVMHKAGEASTFTANSSLDPTIINHLDTVNGTENTYTNDLIERLTRELDALHLPTTNFAQAAQQVERNVLGLNTSTGEIDLSRGLASGYNRPAGGLLSAIGNLRKVDSSNFINIIRPVINEIAVGTTQEITQLNIELSELQTQVGRSPFLKYADVKGGTSTFLQDITAQQYGYKRLETLASALDKVAEYIPANPLLYFKPYRDMVGITSLNVDRGNGNKENYSLRSLLGPGFSGLTKFSRRMMRSLGGLGSTENIVKQMGDNFRLFELEQELNRSEQRLFKDTTKILKSQWLEGSVRQLRTVLDSNPTAGLLQNLTEALYRFSPDVDQAANLTALGVLESSYGPNGVISQTAAELSLSNKSTLIKYKANLATYNSLLQQVDNSTEALSSTPKTTFRAIRGALFSVGPLLILDKVLDPQFMRSPSVDLITQVFIDANLLQDKDTRQAQIEYTGAVPGYIKYPAMGIGFILGGHSLPRFEQQQMAAGGFIEKAITKAANGTNLLDLLNSSPGTTLRSSLLSGLTEDAVNEVASLGKYRTRTRFGWLGAFLGGATALLGTQAVFGMAAGFMNLVRSPFKDSAPKTQPEPMIAAFSLAASVRHRFNNLNDKNPLSRKELGLMEVSYAAANSLLYGKQNRRREVFTFATQIPNPIFQFTAVSKLDPQGNALTLGAGFQFLPILGAGSIPPAPFEIRLKPLLTKAALRKQQLLATEAAIDKQDASKSIETYSKNQNSSFAANALSLLSLPGLLLSVNKDTSFSQIISFVGASSYLASGTNRIENFLRANAGQAVRTELKQIKPLYDIAKFGLGTVETMARYSQVPLLAMPNALMKATTSYFNISQQSLAKFGSRARAIAPYLLAYAFASGITSPEGSFSGAEADKEPNYAAAELSRFAFSVAPITAIYGSGLQKAGVFARADSFDNVTGNGFIARKQQQIAQIAKVASESGTEAPLVRSAALRLSIASRRIFSISAVLAAVGLGVRATTGKSLGFLDIISDSSPAPANPEQAAYWRAAGIERARYQPKNLGEAAGNYANYLVRSIGGLLGIDRLIYRDDSNAFMSLGGPFGVSEGKSGFRLYTQAQATFVDISGSSYSLGETMMSADLAMQLVAVIGGMERTDYEKEKNISLFSDRYQKFRGATPRRTPAKVTGELSSSEAQAASGASSAFISALAYRKAYSDNLRHQRPSELTLDLLMESAKTGRIASRFGFVKPSFNPLATLGSISGDFIGGGTGLLQRAANSLSNFVNQVRGTGTTYSTELMTETPREQQSSLPVIGYFTDTFKYILGGFSGTTTAAASGTLLLQQAPLLLLTVGSSLTFAVQMTAALAAYHHGGLAQDALRQVEDKHLDFRRRGAVQVGSREVKSGYYLTIEPKSGGVKPKVLSLSSQMLEDFSIVSPGEDIDVTKSRIDSISKSVQKTIKDYYNGLQNFVNPQGNSSLNSLDINTLLSRNPDTTDFVSKLRSHVNDNLLQRGVVASTSNGSPLVKFYEILSIKEVDSVLSRLDGLDVEINNILAKTATDDVKKNLIKVSIASKLQNLDSSLFENATAGYLTDAQMAVQFDYSPEIGMARSRVSGLSGSTLATSEIIRTSGYLGLLKQGLQGLGRLTNRAIDAVPFYNIASALTKAASGSDSLERRRAAGAAAFYTSQLPQIGFSIMAMRGLVGLGLGAGIGLVAAGVGLYLADQYFFKGATTKAVQRGGRWVDRNVGSPFTRMIAGVYDTLARTPVVSQLLSVVGLPFRALDPLLDSAWQSAENSPAGYAALSFVLPRTIDQVYQEQAFKNPAYNRAGERMELLSNSEVRNYYKQKLRYNRSRADSLSSGVSSAIAPFLLGGTSSVGEQQIQSMYFDSKGGAPRVLAPFANQSMVSGIQQLAIERREAIAGHGGYGSYKRRRLLAFDGLGKFSILSSVYTKASLVFNGTYQGLLAKGLTEIATTLSWIPRGWNKFTTWTANQTRALKGIAVDRPFVNFSNWVAKKWSGIKNIPAIKGTVTAIKNIPSAIGGTPLGKGYTAVKAGVAERLTDFRSTWGVRFVRGSVFALSAYAVTTLASRIILSVVGSIGSKLDPDNKESAERFYKAAAIASNPSIATGVAGVTFAATLASRRASPLLAKVNTSFYKGLITSLGGAGLYGGTAYAFSFLPALFIKDQKTKESFQMGAAISGGLVGAYRYGLLQPFSNTYKQLGSLNSFTIRSSKGFQVPLNRLTLLEADFNRVKGIGVGTGKFFTGLVPQQTKTSISNYFSNSTWIKNSLGAAKGTFSKLNFKPTSWFKVSRPTKVKLGRFGRSVGTTTRNVGVFARNFAPSLLDIGLVSYAGTQVFQLNNRSTRQQFRAEYQNLVSVSTNAVVGSFLALGMRSPGAALIVALGLERTINPLVGQALGDLGYKDETGLVKTGVLIGSGAALTYSVHSGFTYGLKALSKTPISSGGVSATLKGWAKPASGIISGVQLGLSVGNMVNEANKPANRDYRVVSQSLGKDAAGIVSSFTTSVGLLGGPVGIFSTAVASSVAEPILADFFSKTLERRMRQAGRTSKQSGRELQRSATEWTLGGLVAGVGIGLAVTPLIVVGGAVTAPILATGALIGATAGALIGLYIGIEKFFWGTQASPFDKGEQRNNKLPANRSTSSSKTLQHAQYLQKRNQQQSKNSILVASADIGQSDIGYYSFQKEKEESLSLLDYFKSGLSALGGGILNAGRKVKRVFERLGKQAQDNLFGSQEYVEPSIEGTGGVPVVSTYYTPGEGGSINGPKVDARSQYIDVNSNVAAVRNLGVRGGLPYGSVIQVSNPKTGHAEMLTVQDTGPFVKGQRRGLDITKAAYDRLGGTGLTTFNVRIISAPGAKPGQVFKVETPDNFSYELVYGERQSGGIVQGQGYKIVESVGGRVEQVTSYRDLERHHPSSLMYKNRPYRLINGRMEEVNAANPNLVKKDFVLIGKGGQQAGVNVHAPISGFASVDRDWGAVNIYSDKERRNLIGQTGHMSVIPIVTGQYVRYGQIIGKQSDIGSPNSIHIDMSLTPEQYDIYLKDVQDGVYDGDKSGAASNTNVSLKNTLPAKIANWATPKQPATKNIIFTSGHRIDINTGTGGTDKVGSVLFKGENRTIESVGTEIAAEVFSSVFKSRGFNVIAPPALPAGRGDEARRQYQDKLAAMEASSNAYALELHFDSPVGGKPGVIPGSKYDTSGKSLNVMDVALAKEFGAFSYYWGEGGKDVRQFPDEKLGGPKRGISLLELDRLDPRLTGLIQKGVRTGNFDEFRKAMLPYANRAAEALSLNEASVANSQTYSSGGLKFATQSFTTPKRTVGNNSSYKVDRIVSNAYKPSEKTGETATFFFTETKKTVTLSKLAWKEKGWRDRGWTDGVTDYWIVKKGDIKTFMSNYINNKKPIPLNRLDYNPAPNLDSITRVSITPTEGTYVVPSLTDDIPETERILSKKGFYIKGILGTGFIDPNRNSRKGFGYGFMKVADSVVNVGDSLTLDKFSIGFYTNRKGETRLLNLTNLSAEQKIQSLNKLKTNKDIISAYVITHMLRDSDNKSSGGQEYNTNFMAFDSSGLLLGVVSTSRTEASGRLNDANKAFKGRAKSFLQLDGSFYTKMWFDNSAYKDISNSRALVYKNAVLLVGRTDKNTTQPPSVGSSLTRAEVIKVIRDKYAESLNDDTNVKKLRAKLGNNVKGIPIGIVSKLANTEIFGLSVAKDRAKKEINSLYKDYITRYKIDLDVVTKDILPTNPGIVPKLPKISIPKVNFTKPGWVPDWVPLGNKRSYVPPSKPNQALSESDRQTLISSSLGLSTNQLQKITKEYQQGTQTLDLVKQKVAKQTQNLNIQVEAGGDTPKPSDRPADPLANSIKAAPEVKQTGAVVKTESGVSVRIETKVDDAYQIERAASPFSTRVNKEMASRESQGLSSFNSSGFMDLFGMAEGWTSQQYA